MELHSNYWKESVCPTESKKGQEVPRASFPQGLKNLENGKAFPSQQILLKILEKSEKITLDIPMFNYPVFLILYLLFFSYFCRNAFCCLCQEATNIIQESYMTTDRAFYQQNWNKYREATQNSIFQRKVLDLFGKNKDEDGNYLYKYSTIEDYQIFPNTPALI